MDTVFLDKQQGLPAVVYKSHPQQGPIHTLFRQAIHRATLLEREILASFTYTLPTFNPLSVYKTFISLHLGERLYWEQPSEQKAFVGAEVATTIETQGEKRFQEASELWQRLQLDAVVTTTAQETKNNGLLLLGGFAFDPLRARTEPWDGFEDGLLILPHLLYTVCKEHATLSLNILVKPGDNAEQLTQDSITTLHHIEQALGQVENSASEDEPSPTGDFTLQDLVSASSWKSLVQTTVSKIQHNDYKKVVLARGVQVTHNEEPFNIAESLQRLRTSYPGAYVFAFQRGERTFMGATPERLLQAQNGQIQTMALAGSAPRGANAQEDTYLGAELTRSAKNKEEHDIVVNVVREALERHCEKIWVADTPQLLRLKNIQHLETPIVGKLRTGESVLSAIQDLHPTPAVGGVPREAALQEIREHEGLDRGWYAGPVGWIDAAGNGEFAVALRSALVEKERATLFAGCGIVAGSNPESEYAESCLKLKVMLRGLGAEE